MQISFLCPSIRINNWERLYNSINFTSGDWEIIFVGPHCTDFLDTKSNIKFIKDWGSPNRGQQIALLHAEGEYVGFLGDDSWFIDKQPQSLFNEKVENCVTTAKYIEGDGYNMLNDDYYKLKCSFSQIEELYIDPNYFVLNAGFLPRKMIVEAGGLDCSNFDTTFFGLVDLAIRLQKAGHKFTLSNTPILCCDHEPGPIGTHGPIHYTHIEKDMPLFREIYSNPIREKVDINNWINSAAIWKPRFSDTTLGYEYIEVEKYGRQIIECHYK